MSDEFKLPDIGEGLAEGEIVKWLVAVGDTVEEDQPLVEVMTDKATVEIPSPRAGTVVRITAAEGDIVEIGTTILVFGDGGGAGEQTSTEAPEPAGEGAQAGTPAAAGEAGAGEPTTRGERPRGTASRAELEQAREVARAEREAVEAPAARKPWEAPAARSGAVAPAARRLAAELGVDVAEVAGSGAGGLVTKEDVRAFAEGAPPASAAGPAPPGRSPAAPARSPAAPAQAATPAEPEPHEEPPAKPEAARPEPAPEEPPVEREVARPQPTPKVPPAEPEAARPEPVPRAPAAAGEVERIPLRGLRRTIAERMVQATTTVPHYTYVEEVDMTEVVALREEAKAKAAQRGVKLTYLPFIIRALVLTLKDHPYLNASLDEEAGEVVLKRYYNIGVATSTERGLMVPVVKGAGDRDLLDLAAEISRLSQAARDGTIALEDLQGGTFTITSTGNIGGFLATPIINVPEVAILGVTAIRERPVVREGRIVVRQITNLSLSCDHRVVDGAVAALFVRDLVKLLEDPKLQLLAGL
jgi:pyruvate dehydrogenase E2 component (dihydrolipoamide acetyltransferase)